MQEARYSFNIRFNLDGYDSQLTLRSDEDWLEVLTLGQQALRQLSAWGAKPDRRWESVKSNGHAPEQPKLQPDVRVCPVCQKDDQLELITFANGGKHISKFKCQRCNKWLPQKLQPSEEEVNELLARQGEEIAKLWG